MSTKTKDVPKEKGWLTDGIQKSHAKDAKKASENPPEKTTNETTKAKPATRKSMRDNIMEATRDIETASELGGLLRDAKEVKASQEVVDMFVKVIIAIDALGVFYLSSDMPERKAQNMWASMDWEERENFIADRAKVDEKALKLIKQLFVFYEDADGRVNMPAKVFLHEIVDQFVYPLQWINTFVGLKDFLDKLADKTPPLVTRFYRPKFSDGGNGITIRLGREKGNILYLPKASIAKIERAWPYIKKVEARARALEKEKNTIRAMATQDLTPVKISNGQEGKLFLSLSAKEAVLLSATRHENGEVTVQVTEQIGMETDQIPSDSQLWDKNLHKPASNAGNWFRICKALEEWKKWREETTRAQKKARDDYLAPLTDIATFPTRYENQGLTKILNGEIGIASFWKDGFWFGKKAKGFFGISIEHTGSGVYILKEVVADACLRFSRELIGRPIPLKFNSQEPSVKLQQMDRMPSELWEGLRMVVRLINVRLEQESRYSVQKPADASDTKLV